MLLCSMIQYNRYGANFKWRNYRPCANCFSALIIWALFIPAYAMPAESAIPCSSVKRILAFAGASAGGACACMCDREYERDRVRVRPCPRVLDRDLDRDADLRLGGILHLMIIGQKNTQIRAIIAYRPRPRPATGTRARRSISRQPPSSSHAQIRHGTPLRPGRMRSDSVLPARGFCPQ